MTKQVTSTIMMIRPVAFSFNEETAVNNYYQKVIKGLGKDQVQHLAQKEFDSFVKKLRAIDIDVLVVDDTIEPHTPDSIFPNNWISFHQDGRVALFPMFAENRRLERREDILIELKEKYHFEISEQIDFSDYEAQDLFLEGTGSILLDRVHKVAYASISLRTNQEILNHFCSVFGYESFVFTAYQSVGNNRLPIYHTNVMLCLGERFAILCADCIDDVVERKSLINRITDSGKELIYISEDQKHRFAGNMLQLKNKHGQNYLVMSKSAYLSLNGDQIKQIEKYCTIIYSSLDTIEAIGGGSARCMMAEVFLPKNK